MDYTGGIALLFGVAFLVAFGWEFGWRPALGLVAINTLLGLAWSAALAVFGLLDHWIIWMLGTFAIWPLMFMLGKTITWFGMVH